MGRRPPCCDKSHVKKGSWTAEEDAKILAYVASHGIGNWTLVPQKAGLNRCGKSCRLRWTNYLRPDLKHDSFTPHEEELILMYHQAIGSRWSLIAKQLPGRTDNDVKNHWNTKLKKKLTKMGIDPITHKPFGQLLSDYGHINEIIPQNTRPSDQRHHEPLDFPHADSSLSMMDTFQEQHTPMNLITANFQVKNEAASSSTSSPATKVHVNLPSSPSIWSDYLVQHTPMNLITANFQVKNEAASSSISSPATKVQVNLPSSPSIWSDYLVGDQEQECTTEPDVGMLSANGENINGYNVLGVDHTKKTIGVATTSVSFVESILNRDREMQLDFPQLLDGYSEC